MEAYNEAMGAFWNEVKVAGDSGLEVQKGLDEAMDKVKDVVESDVVYHPKHYTAGDIETIDYIDSVTATMEGMDGYYTGNCIKYLSRFHLKNGVEDLKKARWYLDRLIKKKEKECDI